MKYFLLIPIVLLTACYGKAPEKTGMEGKTLPNFSLLQLDSISVFNTKNIPTGKPFVMFVIGPYCPYSRAQMKAMVADIDKIKDLSIYIISIAPLAEVKEFYKDFSLNKYNNIHIGIDQTNSFGQYLQIAGVPYIAIYNKNKKLTRSFAGETDIQLIKAITDTE